MTTDLSTDVAGVLKVLADPLRWRIVELLSAEELCVCHLVEELDVGQPLVSHHLRALREAGLVESEKWRYWTYYRLQPEPLVAVAAAVRQLSKAKPARERRPCC
jgi:ArsR family transcriptional regulator, arsenate/arsenite/antimonite-responsive transcriptional repressor